MTIGDAFQHVKFMASGHFLWIHKQKDTEALDIVLAESERLRARVEELESQTNE